MVPDNIIWNKKTSQLSLFIHGVCERKNIYIYIGILLSNEDFDRKQTERAAQFQIWAIFFFLIENEGWLRVEPRATELGHDQ